VKIVPKDLEASLRIECDRQVFTPVFGSATCPGTEGFFKMGANIFSCWRWGLSGFVGYRVFTQASQNNAIALCNAQVDTLQAQLRPIPQKAH